MLVIARYKPPDFLSLSAILHKCLDSLIQLYPKYVIILAGDFNYPEIVSPVVPAWMSFGLWQCLPAQARCFADMRNAYLFSQIINQPTRESATLDLFLATKLECVTAVELLEPLSGHLSTHVQINITTPKFCPLVKTLFSYLRADQKALLLYQSSFMLTFFEEFEKRTVGENWDLMKTALIGHCIH